MPTLNDLKTALVNAHNAGDVGAAKALAVAIRGAVASEIENDPISQGAKNFADDLSGFDKFAAGAGKAIADMGLGIRQITGNASQQEVDESKRRDAPLMRTGAGLAGNITGNIAASVLPALGMSGVGANIGSAGLTAAGKFLLASPATLGGVATQGALGATQAAMQPVATGETSRLGNAGFGFLGGAAVPAAGMAIKAAKAGIEPLYDGGRQAIIGRAMRQAAGNNADDVARRLANPSVLVPGSAPTAGEAAESGGIAAMQRAASAIDPEAYAARGMQQNEARIASLMGIAGDDAARAAAVQARKTATAPLLQQVAESTAEVNPARTVSLIDRIIDRSPGRDKLTNALSSVKDTLFEPYPLQQRGKEAWAAVNDIVTAGPMLGKQDTAMLQTVRTVMDRVKKGAIDGDEALAQLKGLKGINNVAVGALDDAKRYLQMPDMKLRSNAGQLYQGARKNITDILEQRAGDGSKVNEAISRELSIVLKSLDNQINKAEPAFGSYLSAYAKGSQPLNQMDVAAEIAKRSVNPLTNNIRPDAFARSLSDDVAKSATGFKRATLDRTMTPDQLATLNAIKSDLARSVQARDLGRGAGSDTVQKLAMTNLMERSGLPVGLLNMPLAGRVGNWAYSEADNQMKQALARAMLNPQEAAMLMRGAVPNQTAQLMGQGLLAAGRPLAVGGSMGLLNSP